jgi:hypothetical protein
LEISKIPALGNKKILQQGLVITKAGETDEMYKKKKTGKLTGKLFMVVPNVMQQTSNNNELMGDLCINMLMEKLDNLSCVIITLSFFRTMTPTLQRQTSTYITNSTQ